MLISSLLFGPVEYISKGYCFLVIVADINVLDSFAVSSTSLDSLNSLIASHQCYFWALNVQQSCLERK